MFKISLYYTNSYHFKLIKSSKYILGFINYLYFFMFTSLLKIKILINKSKKYKKLFVILKAPFRHKLPKHLLTIPMNQIDFILFLKNSIYIIRSSNNLILIIKQHQLVFPNNIYHLYLKKFNIEFYFNFLKFFLIL